MQGHRSARLRIRVDDRADQAPGADLLHQRERALERHHGRVDVGAALEARRRFGFEPDALARSSDGCRQEVRAFEGDAPRRAGHL